MAVTTYNFRRVALLALFFTLSFWCVTFIPIYTAPDLPFSWNYTTTQMTIYNTRISPYICSQSGGYSALCYQSYLELAFMQKESKCTCEYALATSQNSNQVLVTQLQTFYPINSTLSAYYRKSDCSVCYLQSPTASSDFGIIFGSICGFFFIACVSASFAQCVEECLEAREKEQAQQAAMREQQKEDEIERRAKQLSEEMFKELVQQEGVATTDLEML